jgi:hypothetical protein
MADARGRAEWERAAMVCAAVVNANPFRKGQPVQPDAFLPRAYREPAATSADATAAGVGAVEVGIRALMVFVPRPPPPP